MNATAKERAALTVQDRTFMRRLLESVLAQEVEHAEDLVDLLEDLPKD